MPGFQLLSSSSITLSPPLLHDRTNTARDTFNSRRHDAGKMKKKKTADWHFNMSVRTKIKPCVVVYIYLYILRLASLLFSFSFPFCTTRCDTDTDGSTLFFSWLPILLALVVLTHPDVVYPTLRFSSLVKILIAAYSFSLFPFVLTKSDYLSSPSSFFFLVATTWRAHTHTSPERWAIHWPFLLSWKM